MTTRSQAETFLFVTSQFAKLTTAKKPTTDLPQVKGRRRLDATYCPHCRGWVEVRLNPVRLHCTGCGVEAKP